MKKSVRLNTVCQVADEYILFRDSLLAYKQGLSTEKQELFERLVAGEHFLGRQSMLKDLRKKLSDFKEK